MPEYQLYCFAQSGNAYRAALMLNLIGADWEPVLRRLLQGRDALTGVSRRGQRNGRGAGARARRQEAQPVGRDPDLSGAAAQGQYLPQGEDEEFEAMRWIIFDNQKVNGFLGPYRFLKNFAKPAGDPAVLSFFKGRIDGNLGVVNKRLENAAVPARRPADHRGRVARGVSLLPGRGIRLRHRQGPSGDRGLARADEGAAGLGASLRPDAGAPVAGRDYRAVSPPSIANSAPVTKADSSDSR